MHCREKVETIVQIQCFEYIFGAFLEGMQKYVYLKYTKRQDIHELDCEKPTSQYAITETYELLVLSFIVHVIIQGFVPT